MRGSLGSVNQVGFETEDYMRSFLLFFSLIIDTNIIFLCSFPTAISYNWDHAGLFVRHVFQMENSISTR